MSNFRNRAVDIVVDTTKQAEFDFASHRIAEAVQEKIAGQLKLLPRSQNDRVFGDFRVREIGEWDVCYTVAPDGAQWVILICGIELPGKMETALELLTRASLEGLPEPVQVLMEGRKKL